MYNFTELITSPVIVHKADNKYPYKANFTVGVHVCRQFFLGNVSLPDVEAVIRGNGSPVRPGRSSPRNLSAIHAISFTYRIALIFAFESSFFTERVHLEPDALVLSRATLYAMPLT